MQKPATSPIPQPAPEPSSTGSTLRVVGFAELDSANSNLFRDQTRAALTATHTSLDVDLSKTRFVDSSGLGALISLFKTMCARNGKLRLLQPTPAVRQMLELTRMHRLFEITN